MMYASIISLILLGARLLVHFVVTPSVHIEVKGLFVSKNFSMEFFLLEFLIDVASCSLPQVLEFSLV